MNNNKFPSKKGRCLSSDADLSSMQPGDFFWQKDHLTFLPPGVGDNFYLTSIAVSKNDAQTDGKTWIWNGNRNKPTLTPSIVVLSVEANDLDTLATGDVEIWHGHLTDGHFIGV